MACPEARTFRGRNGRRQSNPPNYGRFSIDSQFVIVGCERFRPRRTAICMPLIAFRDFGPIAHANIDLKPLTVLIGSNNTGKSYLALALYAFWRVLSDAHFRNLERPEPRLWTTLPELSRNSISRWRELFKDTQGVRGVLSGQDQLKTLPREILARLGEQSIAWSEDLRDGVEYELRRCFGSDLSQLGRRDRHTHRSHFEVNIRDADTGLDWDIECDEDELVSTRWAPDLSRSSTGISQDDIDMAHLLVNDPERLFWVLSNTYSAYLLGGCSAPSHYLPASRSGIFQGHKTLASLLIGRSSRAWIESMEVERLPGVITDLVQALLILDRAKPAAGRIKTIVNFLESRVLGGSVDIVRQEENAVLRFQNSVGAFDLHQVSSTVSEIAPMVLYLKYLVKPGHLFILEEPESHLDPANQRLVARAIAMLVNAGVRVLVTTHSDIFLHQINNLMQIFSLEPRRRLRMGYKAVEVLRPSDVSAYLFPHADTGTRVRRLRVDSEQGISTESSDSVHQALYDESIRMEHAP